MSPKDSKHDNWLSEDPFFKSKFPFQEISDSLNIDQSYIDQYVKDVLKRSSLNNTKTGFSPLFYEVFELHNFVIAKISIPRKIHPENLSIFVNSMQIKIEGLPGGNKQIIPLPTPVNSAQSKATFKQSSLQIKTPKKPIGRFKEVYLRFL